MKGSFHRLMGFSKCDPGHPPPLPQHPWFWVVLVWIIVFSFHVNTELSYNLKALADTYLPFLLSALTINIIVMKLLNIHFRK